MSSFNNKIYNNAKEKQYIVYSSTPSSQVHSLSLFDLKAQSNSKYDQFSKGNEFMNQRESYGNSISLTGNKILRNSEVEPEHERRSREPQNQSSVSKRRSRRSRFRVSPVRSRSISRSTTLSARSHSQGRSGKNNLRMPQNDTSSRFDNSNDSHPSRSIERRLHARKLALAALNDTADNSAYTQTKKYAYPQTKHFAANDSTPISNVNNLESNEEINRQGIDLHMFQENNVGALNKSNRSYRADSQAQIEKEKKYKKRTSGGQSDSFSQSIPYHDAYKNNNTFEFETNFPDIDVRSRPQHTQLQQVYNESSEKSRTENRRKGKVEFDNFLPSSSNFSTPTQKNEYSTPQSNNTSGAAERRRRRLTSATKGTINASNSHDSEALAFRGMNTGNKFLDSTHDMSFRSKKQNDRTERRSNHDVVAKAYTNHSNSQSKMSKSYDSSIGDTSFFDTVSNDTPMRNQNRDQQNKFYTPTTNNRPRDANNTKNSPPRLQIPNHQSNGQSDGSSTISSSSDSFRFDAFGLDAQIDNEVSQWMQDIDTNEPEIHELGMKASEDIAFFFETDFSNLPPIDSSNKDQSVHSNNGNISVQNSKSFTELSINEDERQKQDDLFPLHQKSNSADKDKLWAFNKQSAEKSLRERKQAKKGTSVYEIETNNTSFFNELSSHDATTNHTANTSLFSSASRYAQPKRDNQTAQSDHSNFPVLSSLANNSLSSQELNENYFPSFTSKGKSEIQKTNQSLLSEKGLKEHENSLPTSEQIARNYKNNRNQRNAKSEVITRVSASTAAKLLSVEDSSIPKRFTDSNISKVKARLSSKAEKETTKGEFTKAQDFHRNLRKVKKKQSFYDDSNEKNPGKTSDQLLTNNEDSTSTSLLNSQIHGNSLDKRDTKSDIISRGANSTAVQLLSGEDKINGNSKNKIFTENNLTNVKARLSLRSEKERVKEKIKTHDATKTRRALETPPPDYNDLWGRNIPEQNNAIVETKAYECMLQRTSLRKVVTSSPKVDQQKKQQNSEIDAARRKMKERINKRAARTNAKGLSREISLKEQNDNSVESSETNQNVINQNQYNSVTPLPKKDDTYQDSDSYRSKKDDLPLTMPINRAVTPSPIPSHHSNASSSTNSEAAIRSKISNRIRSTTKHVSPELNGGNISVSSNQQLKHAVLHDKLQPKTVPEFFNIELRKTKQKEKDPSNEGEYEEDMKKDLDSVASSTSQNRAQNHNNLSPSSSQSYKSASVEDKLNKAVPPSPPKAERDVALLIRRRIAKNRELTQKTNAIHGENGKEQNEMDANNMKPKLRKVRITKPPPAPPALPAPPAPEKEDNNTGDIVEQDDEGVKLQYNPEKNIEELHEIDMQKEQNKAKESNLSMTASSVIDKFLERKKLSIHSNENQDNSSSSLKDQTFLEETSRDKDPKCEHVPTSSVTPKKDVREEKASPLAVNPITSAMLLSQIKSRKKSKDDQTTVLNPTKMQEEKSDIDKKDEYGTLKEDPEYQKYFKMLKVGLPLDVVKHAMMRDGKNPNVLDGDQSKSDDSEGIPLNKDPKYQKYFKMLKVGLPMDAVKHAIQRDGLDPTVMDGDHNKPISTRKKNDSSNVYSLSKSKENVAPKDTHRRTRLHWDTLHKVRNNSVWALVNQDPEVEDINIDETEFAQLFQAELSPATNKILPIEDKESKKRNAVKVIDPKRANNGGIILARIKVSYENMAIAIDTMDDTVMDQHQLTGILEYLPTKNEIKSLKSFLDACDNREEGIDSLCECEKFMVAILNVKHFKRKVRALVFKLQFISCIDEVLNDANLIGQACSQLSKSVRLRKLLGIVLNIGNRLNTAGTTKKGKAGAFTLDSLLKLNQAKSFDKKTTFLHYVILIVKRNNPQLLSFKDDLPSVFKAEKIYWDQCLLDLEEAENQLENVRLVALQKARESQPEWTRTRTKHKNLDDDCSISDESLSLEEEVASLRSTDTGLFTLEAIRKVSALREKVEKTKTTYAKLLEYFGEDEKGGMQPHELFEIIVTFVRNFESSHKEVELNEKARLRAEKKKRSNEEKETSQKLSSKSKTVSKSTTPTKSNQTTRTSMKIKASSMQPNMGFVLNDIKNFSKGFFKKKAVDHVPLLQGNEIVDDNKQNSNRNYEQNTSNAVVTNSKEEKGHDLAKMAKDSNLSTLENIQEISNEGSKLKYKKEATKNHRKGAGRSYESQKQVNPHDDAPSENIIGPQITASETLEQATDSSYRKLRSKDQNLTPTTTQSQPINHTISKKSPEEPILNSDTFMNTSTTAMQSSMNSESNFPNQNIPNKHKTKENTQKLNPFDSSKDNHQKVDSSIAQSITNNSNVVRVTGHNNTSVQTSETSHGTDYPVDKEIITNSSSDSRESKKYIYSEHRESSPLTLIQSSPSKSLSARRNERLRRHRQIMQRKNGVSSPANVPIQTSSSPLPEIKKTPESSVKAYPNSKNINVSSALQRRQKNKARLMNSQLQKNSSSSKNELIGRNQISQQTDGKVDLRGIKVKVDWPVPSSNFDMQLDVE